MERSRPLLRDYGLALALVLCSALLVWRTLIPQMRNNRALDRMYVERLQAEQRLRAELERLETLRGAACDPLVVERMAREVFRDLGLPADEVFVPESGPEGPAGERAGS